MDSSLKRWWTVTFLIFLPYVSPCYAQQCNATDLKALQEFIAGFTATGNYFDTWKAEANCCVWNGVNCTGSGRVQGLKIYNPYPRYPFPVAVRNMSYQGVVGATLGDLSALRTLELSSIWFNGPMPNSFNKLQKLEELRMSFNNFSGSLSPSIGGATSLKNLRVDGQSLWFSFAGLVPAPIPSSFCSLTNLQTLDVTSFTVTGKIPSCFCSFAKLTRCALNDNNLKTEIPNCIGYSLRNLEYLSLSSNKFTGPIPSTLCSLLNLQTLDLSQNKFSRRIPSEIGNLVKLQVLNLGNNSLSESIPASLGRLTELIFLDLSLNFLTRIPPELGKLEKISWMTLSFNILQGKLPPEIGNLGSKTDGVYFDISYNRLSGSIPDIFGSPKIRNFFAANNLFSGGFPLTLAMVDNVDLSNNFLWDLNQVGNLPPTPRIYNLMNNSFSGPLPSWFKDLMVSAKDLIVVDISVNKFSGPFPASVLGNPSVWNLNASYNSFSGQLPTQPFTAGFGFLDLSHNKISGPITPTFFASLINATHLDLSFNKLSGALPGNSGEFRELSYLDLSDNQLSGKVPESIEKMPFLWYLDLSNNKFTGTVPKKPPPP